jgi:hypothetical protein
MPVLGGQEVFDWDAYDESTNGAGSAQPGATGCGVSNAEFGMYPLFLANEMSLYGD